MPANDADSLRRDPRARDLVATRKIRAGLFLPQYSLDAAGAIIGRGTGYVGIALARELAARLGVEARIVPYPTPSAVVADLKSGACDMAFLGIEPTRAAQLDFSPAVFEFDYTYLVPASSAIKTAIDAERAGVRVALVSGHASDLALRRGPTQAELIGAELPDDAFALLRAGEADALALPRDVLLGLAERLPGSRVLDDRYGVNQVGVAIAKGQADRLALLSDYVEAAKASGLVQGAIESGHLIGFRVAPPGVSRVE